MKKKTVSRKWSHSCQFELIILLHIKWEKLISKYFKQIPNTPPRPPFPKDHHCKNHMSSNFYCNLLKKVVSNKLSELYNWNQTSSHQNEKYWAVQYLYWHQMRNLHFVTWSIISKRPLPKSQIIKCEVQLSCNKLEKAEHYHKAIYLTNNFSYRYEKNWSVHNFYVYNIQHLIFQIHNSYRYQIQHLTILMGYYRLQD